MSTLETLQDILVREFDLAHDQLAPTAELNTLGVDSLDLLELMFKIEDCYGIAIKGDIPTDLLTVGDVVVYIDRLLARSPSLDAIPGTPPRPNVGLDSR
jgi:acyl carrier protein